MTETLPDAFWIYITCSSADEAKHLARTLLEERLIACANISGGVTSMYWWDGAVQEDEEWVLVAKTQRILFEAVSERVRQLHSYETPCVIALPIQQGNPAYLAWLAGETRPPA